MAMGARSQVPTPAVTTPKGPDSTRLYPSIATESKISPLGQAFQVQLNNLLPSQPVIAALVPIYFEEIAWSWRVCCRPQFLAELREFNELRNRNQLASVDPAWVAFLLIVLATVVTTVSDGQIESIGLTDASTEKATSFFEASKVALTLSGAMEVPQMRAIQVRFRSPA
jgi:hypothetical protein